MKCDGCGGEDCACCEVFIEEQMDEQYQRLYGDDYGYDQYEPTVYYNEDDDDLEEDADDYNFYRKED